MEAIKQLKTVKNGKIQLHLPKRFWDKKVEIVVLALPEKKTMNLQKKSLRGCLQHYANPALISHEQNAWHDAVKEKHGDH